MEMIRRYYFSLLLIAFILIKNEYLSQELRFSVTKLHRAINSSIDEIIDVSNFKSFARVYKSGNLCPFKRKITSKLHKNETLRIQILGGSATFGSELNDSEHERWSFHFNNYMNSGWYEGDIIVDNLALPSCGIDSWIHKVNIFKEADLVIVDVSVNDQFLQLQSLQIYYKSLIQSLDELVKHPAIMFVQTFRTAKYDKKDLIKHCPGANEQGQCCNGYGWCKKWWDMQDFVVPTLSQYKVPYISYRDLVWPEYAEPPETLPLFWNGMSHPDAKNHKLFGKMIAYAFMRQVHDSMHHNFCHNITSERYIHGSEFDICSVPITSMFASDTPESVQNFKLHTNHIGGSNVTNVLQWKYYNDAGKKYGWILLKSLDALDKICHKDNSNDCQKSYAEYTQISFDMEFGQSPILQVNYLKSYNETMGTVILWLDDNATAYIELEGFWKEKYNVHHFTTVTSKPIVNMSSYAAGDTSVLATLTPGKHVVHIAVGSFSGESKLFKWKLFGLSSC